MALNDIWRRLLVGRAEKRKPILTAAETRISHRRSLERVFPVSPISTASLLDPAPKRASLASRTDSNSPLPAAPSPIALDVHSYPSIALLDEQAVKQPEGRAGSSKIGRKIEAKCRELGVHGEIVAIHPGPVVTTYEFRPSPGIRASQVLTLSEDLAMALSADSVRIERVAGKACVGIEVPNSDSEKVIGIREVIGSEKFQSSPSLLTLALGKDSRGGPVVADLRSIPHLLIAGSTGSGKSVCINTLLTSILFKARPDQVRLILIDPRMLELRIYDHLPHLLTPVITDSRKAAHVLSWAVRAMKERFQLLADVGQVRDIEQYNTAIQDPDVIRRMHAQDPSFRPEPMPLILIVVDEVSELQGDHAGDIMRSLSEILPKGHTVGLHVILSTQKPSSLILPETLKARFLGRIAFRVASVTDSQAILDCAGAERLEGYDLLFRREGVPDPIRVHAAYTSVRETARVVTFVKQAAPPSGMATSIGLHEQLSAPRQSEDDPLYAEAVQLVIREQTASVSQLQRSMGIGFTRAGKLIDMMARDGLLGPQRGSHPREVLVRDSRF